MLDLYTWRTPNGKKAPILLEELGWPYELHLINLGQGDQRKPEYLAINPNGKIPALVDPEGPNGLVVVFESGAILEYLADKSGRFLPKDQPGRAEVKIRDWGNGVNPQSRMPVAKDPLTPGGLGLVCLRQLMDDISYQPQNDGMLMMMSKKV